MVIRHGRDRGKLRDRTTRDRLRGGGLKSSKSTATSSNVQHLHRSLHGPSPKHRRQRWRSRGSSLRRRVVPTDSSPSPHEVPEILTRQARIRSSYCSSCQKRHPRAVRTPSVVLSIARHHIASIRMGKRGCVSKASPLWACRAPASCLPGRVAQHRPGRMSRTGDVHRREATRARSRGGRLGPTRPRTSLSPPGFCC